MNEPRDAADDVRAAPDPFRDPELDAALATQGPLTDEVAQPADRSGSAAARRRRSRAGGRGLPAGRRPSRRESHGSGAARDSATSSIAPTPRTGQRPPGRPVTKLPENASTYGAWKRLAGVHVRANELPDAHRGLPPGRSARPRGGQGRDRVAPRLAREGDGQRRAPPASTSRELAGAAGLLLTYVVLAVTAAGLAPRPSQSDEPARPRSGSIRSGSSTASSTASSSVTLVHGGFPHLFLNMYALYIVGPVVESIWGKRMFLLFYVLAAIGGATGSFLFSHAPVRRRLRRDLRARRRDPRRDPGPPSDARSAGAGRSSRSSGLFVVINLVVRVRQPGRRPEHRQRRAHRRADHRPVARVRRAAGQGPDAPLGDAAPARRGGRGAVAAPRRGRGHRRSWGSLPPRLALGGATL